jgi:hypothetical protein
MAKRQKGNVPKAPTSSVHPLLAPRVVSAVGLFSISAVGIGMMLAAFIVTGWLISLAAACGTIWLYGPNRLIDCFQKPSAERPELWIALILIAADLGLPLYIWGSIEPSHAKMIVSHIEIPRDEDFLTVHVFRQNTGNADAIGSGLGSDIRWVEPNIPDAELDALLDEVYNSGREYFISQLGKRPI